MQVSHPTFQLKQAGDGGYRIDGGLSFDTQIDGKAVVGEYQIEVAVSASYPKMPPTVKETSGHIPLSFHRFTSSNNLCLAAPIEVIRIFYRDKTLDGYVSNLVLPYLINFQHQKRYGTLPFGELPHGDEGILNYYQTRFATDILPTLRLLKLLANNKTGCLIKCPCGTGLSIRDCHYQNLKELSQCYTSRQFSNELSGILSWCLERNLITSKSEFTSVSDRRLRRRKLKTLFGRRS
ncbi:hypothetical protein [Rosistilla oblonga]|uniref:hypothetical protein n=1 Tax=Rosistilla oblonga TaxID=2527990 RepID=UPI003A973CEF